MKIRMTVIAIIGMSLGVSAQDNKIELSSNVGIGTTNPSVKLHINNGSNSYGAILANSSEKAFGLYTKSLGRVPYTETFRLGLKHNNDENNGFISFYRGGSTNGGFLGFSTNGSERIRIDKNGNVGVGTISPSTKLDVNGHIKFDALGSNYTNIQLGHDPNDRIFADNSLDRYYGGGMFFRVTPDPSLGIQHNYIDVMMLTDKGKVGIGTRTTGNHRLAVEGSIGAREIKVEASGWSDFVFENDYNLPTLKEVENHIKEKGHLKDIPSAKEVAKNGILLGEMDSKLLQKIEELTLYTIAQQKEIERLKLIEKRLSKIEKLLESKK